MLEKETVFDPKIHPDQNLSYPKFGRMPAISGRFADRLCWRILDILGVVSSAHQAEMAAIERVKKGDGEAFGQIYDRYREEVYNFILGRVGGIEDAEDLTQEVFLNVFRVVPTYQDQGRPFGAYIFRTAHNTVANFYRERSRQSAALERLTPPLNGWEDPQLCAERQFEIAQVLKIIQELPAAQRSTITMHYFGEMNCYEIGSALNISPNAARASIHRALGTMRTRMVEIPAS